MGRLRIKKKHQRPRIGEPLEPFINYPIAGDDEGMTVTAPIYIQSTFPVSGEEIREGIEVIDAAMKAPGLDPTKPPVTDIGSDAEQIRVQINDTNPMMRSIMRVQSHFRKKAGIAHDRDRPLPCWEDKAMAIHTRILAFRELVMERRMKEALRDYSEAEILAVVGAMPFIAGTFEFDPEAFIAQVDKHATFMRERAAEEEQ